LVSGSELYHFETPSSSMAGPGGASGLAAESSVADSGASFKGHQNAA
jgi:hypothetical protein